MNSPFHLALPRLRLARILVLLFAVLLPLCAVRTQAATVRDTFLDQMSFIEEFFRSAGTTPATATSAQWKAAFRAAEIAYGQASTLRLRFYLAYCAAMPGHISVYVAAVTALENDRLWVVGKGDFGATRFANPYIAVLLGRQAATGKEFTVTPASIPVSSFPVSATNKFSIGISLDASIGYGYYEQTGAVTAAPYYYDPKSQTATAIPLPTAAGATATTVTGGSSTGNVLVGETTRGTGTSRTINPMLWRRNLGDPFATVDIPPAFGSTRTQASGISGDGSAVIGSYLDSQSRPRAYRWTMANGHIDLGVLPGQTSSQSTATTQDGSRVVGVSGSGAFSWTQTGGMRMLAGLSGLTRSQALCIAPDGAFIGGSGFDSSFRETAQLWTDTGSVYDLGKVLDGYGANVTGWAFNQITSIVKNSDETYNIAGNATLNGAPQGFVFQLAATSGAVPAVTQQPRAQAAGVGGTAVFSVSATNATSYTWLRDGVAISGATNSTLTLTNVQAINAGTYTCLVTNPDGSATSAPATLTVAPAFSRLNNLSVRSTAGTGANTLIVGLTTAGGTKDILLRGVGPTLGQFGVTGTLADPQLALFNSSSVQTAQNDDWGGGAALAATFGSVGAFPLGTTSKDAALLTTLAPGGYSAQVSGVGGATGVVLVESYDSDVGSPLARYTNLSARNQVGTGANILIVGFNLAGSGPKNLLIRAVGPSLAQFGVAGTLADPQLAIFNAAGTQTNQNDDWGGGAALSAAFTSVGAFALPATSKDAALSVTLQPGSYTAQVSGVGNTTGVALVEIYELP